MCTYINSFRKFLYSADSNIVKVRIGSPKNDSEWTSLCAPKVIQEVNFPQRLAGLAVTAQKPIWSWRNLSVIWNDLRARTPPQTDVNFDVTSCHFLVYRAYARTRTHAMWVANSSIYAYRLAKITAPLKIAAEHLRELCQILTAFKKKFCYHWIEN